MKQISNEPQGLPALCSVLHAVLLPALPAVRVWAQQHPSPCPLQAACTLACAVRCAARCACCQLCLLHAHGPSSTQALLPAACSLSPSSYLHLGLCCALCCCQLSLLGACGRVMLLVLGLPESVHAALKIPINDVILNAVLRLSIPAEAQTHRPKRTDQARDYLNKGTTGLRRVHFWLSIPAEAQTRMSWVLRW